MLLPAFAVTWAGVSGASAPEALGPERGWISAIALSPGFAADGRAWVAPFGGRIFASSDHGGSWSPAHVGETDPVVTGISVSPDFDSDHTLFAAADDGVFRSADAGLTWSNVSGGLAGHFARSILISPDFRADRTAWVSTDGGVYRSQDGGSSWQAPLDHNVAVGPVAEIAGGELLSAPSSGGLLSSNDGGRTWMAESGFTPSGPVLALSASEDGTTILAGTNDGLWRFTAAQNAWTQVISGDRIAAVSFSPDFARDGTAYAASGGGGGLERSTDGGASWQPLATPFQFVQSLAVSPTFSSDHTLFIGSPGLGLASSRDAGDTWTSADSGLHAAPIKGLDLDGAAVVALGNGGAADLNPTTGSWDDLPLPSSFVTAYAASSRVRFLGTQDRGLFTSTNRAPFVPSTSLPSSEVSALGVSPRVDEDGVVLAAAGYVYRSGDGGQMWSRATGITGNDVRRFSFSPDFSSDQTVFAATSGHGVMMSADGGSDWTSASAGLPHDEITDICFSPRYPSEDLMYAATAGDGLYTSADGGKSWQPAANPVPDNLVTALAWSADGTELLVGTQRGVYSLEKGTWTSLAPGWDDYITGLISLYEGDTEQVYAGTLGDGVWRMSIGSRPATPTPAASPTAPPTPTATAASTPTTRPGHRLSPHVYVSPSSPVAGSPAVVSVRGPGKGTVTVALALGGWKRLFRGRIATDGWAAFGFVPPAGKLVITVTVRSVTQSATVRLSVTVRPKGSHRPR